MKLERIITLIGLIILAFALPSRAQVESKEIILPDEQVILHLDRNIALSGETIWFKAYCFVDGSLDEELSKVLYIEVFDDAEKILLQEKYTLENNTSSGSIRIPEDATSKYYYLKAYTSYMRNFSPEAFHYQQLTIVNPSIEGGMQEAKEVETNSLNGTLQEGNTQDFQRTNKLEIEISKREYQAREKITFTVKSQENNELNLAATVRFEGLGNHPSPSVIRENKWLLASCIEDPFCAESLNTSSRMDVILEKEQPIKKKASSIDELHWLPETKGLSISGLILNQNNEGVSGVLSTVSVLQKDPMLYMGKSDESGKFHIVLHDLANEKNFFVGTSNKDHKVLIRNDFEAANPDVSAVPLQYDTTIHSLLESLNLHQQLINTYPKDKTKVVFESIPIKDSLTNIVDPDRRVLLSEYVEIPTMIEVFREVIPGIQVQKDGGEESLSIFNFDRERYYENPMVLIDNVPVYNIEELLKISPSMVEAVEVYQSNYILGDYTVGGIISVITKTDNFAGYDWGEQVAFTSFKGLAENEEFEQVMHEGKSHYPDFMPVLYWQPSLKIGNSGVSDDIELFAPDLPGTYEILVQGFTENGLPCMGYLSFEVVNDYRGPDDGLMDKK